MAGKSARCHELVVFPMFYDTWQPPQCRDLVQMGASMQRALNDAMAEVGPVVERVGRVMIGMKNRRLALNVCKEWGLMKTGKSNTFASFGFFCEVNPSFSIFLMVIIAIQHCPTI